MLGDLEDVARVPRERLAECLTLLRICHRFVDRLLRGADAGQRDDRAIIVEGFHRLRKACGIRAELVISRHANAIEEERAAAAQLAASAVVHTARDTGRIERHDEGTDALRPGTSHAREYDTVIRVPRHRDRGLFPAYYPFVSVKVRAGLDRRRIGSRIRLGEAERDQRVARCQCRQQGLSGPVPPHAHRSGRPRSRTAARTS